MIMKILKILCFKLLQSQKMYFIINFKWILKAQKYQQRQKNNKNSLMISHASTAETADPRRLKNYKGPRSKSGDKKLINYVNYELHSWIEA